MVCYGHTITPFFVIDVCDIRYVLTTTVIIQYTLCMFVDVRHVVSIVIDIQHTLHHIDR